MSDNVAVKPWEKTSEKQTKQWIKAIKTSTNLTNTIKPLHNTATTQLTKANN